MRRELYLGLAEKNTIVSASSEGPGKSCALALVCEGADVVCRNMRAKRA